jgi:dethiobiotin synthetase
MQKSPLTPEGGLLPGTSGELVPGRTSLRGDGGLYFITANHTGAGKTLVSAVFVQALGADYWKPVQAGTPGDTEEVKGLIFSPGTRFHPERFRLQAAMSPHAAARLENTEIRLDDFQLPDFQGDLVIEGAGGLLVPLNDTDFVIDLATRFSAEIVLVSDVYLGSINHTLLSFAELQRRNIPVKGIIFNRAGNLETENIILLHTGLPCLLKIPELKEITPETVRRLAEKLILHL